MQTELAQENADGTTTKKMQMELPKENADGTVTRERRWNCHERTQTELSRENADGTAERERKLYDFFMRLDKQRMTMVFDLSTRKNTR